MSSTSLEEEKFLEIEDLSSRSLATSGSITEGLNESVSKADKENIESTSMQESSLTEEESRIPSLETILKHKGIKIT